jgi:hypothetical protein
MMRVQRLIRSSGWGVVLGLLASYAAQAGSWVPPTRELTRYGVQTMVCDRAGQVPICLGLACRNGTLELVSAAGGGGPMEGPTRVSTGKTSFSLNFLFDPEAVNQLGLTAARVKLSSGQVSALTDALEVTLTAGYDRRVRHRFSSQNQAQEWRRVRASCRASSSDRHNRDKVDKDAVDEVTLALAGTMLLPSRTNAPAGELNRSASTKVSRWS